MEKLPPAFLKSMKNLLGEEFQSFLDSFKQPATTGLRVNTLKISPRELRERIPYELTPLPWSPAGFQLSETQSGCDQPSPGKHPYHAAGLYYLQEPSAMAVAEAIEPQPGEHILDLCAAPGGKATHLAALLGNRGLLMANEVHPGRVWELAENLERWGAQNVVITNESPKRLADKLGAFFDKVLVDAPCSGESMFRKSVTARLEWSPQVVRSCTQRQSVILKESVRLVRPGGLLVYSTCAFNPQENEEVIADLLARHCGFELIETATVSDFSPGRPDWIDTEKGLPGLERAIRLWPHRISGEGHFFVLLRNSESNIGAKQSNNWAPPEPGETSYSVPQRAIQLFQEFCRDNLLDEPLSKRNGLSLLAMVGTYLYRIPEGLPPLDGLRVIHPGWWLGTLKEGKRGRKTRFEPSHALAMGMNAKDARLLIDLRTDEPEVLTYLRGETLKSEGPEGWTLVTVDGFPLGWGRRVQSQLKNYYPRGLRWF